MKQNDARIKKIVVTGGPGTGKTTLIDKLKERNFHCLPEISRQVTLEARKQGIEQLFLTDPILFSRKLMEGRINQYHEAMRNDEGLVFFDRGIPDVLAYMDYIGDKYPSEFEEACHDHLYDQVFVLPPWKDIYISDNERYENYDQARRIHDHLLLTYDRFGYRVYEVPTGTPEVRTDYIINNITG
ncbi:AAA family ATPase [Robertkochia sediminum]|uniref:AAA family ATPase n=1 Tax=Robertkochia sediminum TaxID=2785326 RepID=UPI0019339161|nr:ATP-binding protein [Robertkochia sediminum]MBL7474169.1 ATP-binding protein [Robertkochia sediminum]